MRIKRCWLSEQIDAIPEWHSAYAERQSKRMSCWLRSQYTLSHKANTHRTYLHERLTGLRLLTCFTELQIK